jgi:branched-chain amino acid transport system permease protein
MNRLSPLQSDLVIAALVAAIGVMLAFVGLSNYILGQATLFLIWASVVTQWNLVLGVAGIFSIGQMALFAVGGYAVALLGLYFGISPWFSLPIAALAGLAMSLVLGFATLRLRGAYTVVVTLSVALVLYNLITSDVDCFRHQGPVCYSLTGGARGLSRFGDFRLNTIVPYTFVAAANYLVALALLIISTLAAIVIVHSPYGKAFQAMRDNELAARARGVDIKKFQLIVFAAAGVFTGLAGGVYAGTQKTFGPQVLEFPTLLFLLSIMIVGGRGAIWGPVLGTAALALVKESSNGFAQWENTSYAVALILILLLFPQGLVGLVPAAGRGLSRLRAAMISA